MKTLRTLLHYLGIHNSKCRRKVFTSKKTHLCMVTGKIYKTWKTY